MLAGCTRMQNACAPSHIKKMLGKHSSCVPTVLGDAVDLLKHFSVDRHPAVTGRLPLRGDVNDGKLGHSAEWVLKTTNDRSDKQLQCVEVLTVLSQCVCVVVSMV